MLKKKRQKVDHFFCNLEKNYMKKDNFTTLDNRSSMSQCYTFVFIYHYHLRHCVVGKINDKDLM